jgi:membrane associated rhomboid family serine protease
MYRGQFGLFAQPLTAAVRALIVANVVTFILQIILNTQLSRMLGVEDAFERVFGLSRDYLPWQILTYMFLHGGVMHILFNMLILYFLGTEIERTLGSRNFLIIYFVSGILGGLGWLALAGPNEVCIGASGAIFGLLSSYITLFPHRYITVLIFFILPVTLRAWMLAAILAGMEFLLMTHAEGRSGIAHSAHLAGLIAGYVFAFVVFRKGGFNIRIIKDKNPAGLHILRRDEVVSVSSTEVDRILDKIAHEGLHSLTRQERTTLEKASKS